MSGSATDTASKAVWKSSARSPSVAGSGTPGPCPTAAGHRPGVADGVPRRARHRHLRQPMAQPFDHRVSDAVCPVSGYPSPSGGGWEHRSAPLPAVAAARRRGCTRGCATLQTSDHQGFLRMQRFWQGFWPGRWQPLQPTMAACSRPTLPTSNSSPSRSGAGGSGAPSTPGTGPPGATRLRGCSASGG